MEVRIIPAKKKIGTAPVPSEERPKLRVAAYCRVSTDLEEQESSYEAQVRHYTETILRNPDWTLAGIYADEGISGTGTKKREEFNRMIQGCLDGEIDMIITKAISRFARNTLDCLKYIRLLKEKRIPIYFEKENINTLDAKGEVLITIMASLAQQESESISQNVRMGIQYQYQQGKVRVNHNWFLGYTKDADGHLVIVPEEAETVRRIFREFLEGRSTHQIARDLERDGIKTGAGRTKWYSSTVRTMLMNEKYMGDALLQKNYTVDFLTKKKVKNTGELPQYYVENNHEPIISRETFQLVQGELQKRANKYSESGMHESHSCKYALSGNLICSHCGSTYRRMKANGSNITTTWRCKKRLLKGTPCHGRIVREPEAHAAVLNALNQLAAEKPALKARHEEILSGPLSTYDAELAELDTQIAGLQNSFTRYAELTAMGEIDREMTADMNHVAVALEKARKRKREINEQKTVLAQEEAHLANLLSFIESRENKQGQYRPAVLFDEATIYKLLKQIRVLDHGYRIEFQVGRTYEV